MKDFIGTGLAALASAGVINDWSVPLFGVPLTVIGMAAAGAYLSYAYGKPESSRKKLYTMAIANTFLATVCVAVLPQWLGWEWTNSKIEAPLAGLFAFGARFAVQPFIDTIPEIIRKLFKLREYSEVNKDEQTK